jgi:hypothetical protein
MKLGFILFAFLLTTLPFAETFASGLELKKKVLISVGDLKNNKDNLWKKQVCDQIYNVANQISDNNTDVTCRSFDTAAFYDTELSQILDKYDYHMRILKSTDGSVDIDITNVHRIHETDFKTLGWNFKDGEKSKITKEEAMAKAIGNFFYYASNETAFKAGLLVNGVHESDEVSYDRENGVFKDKITNNPISINKAYSIYEHESERKKNYLRTGVEIGVLLSSAMAIYYKNLVFNQVDFDYSLQSGIKGKLNGSAIRFDDNDKGSNYGHEYAGVMYYQMARANGFNSLESFLISYASSTTWEFMEYHEVLSINDEILTPIGGYVIGEASYQISCALLQKNNIVAKTLGYTINPGLAANHSIDKYKSGNKFASQPDCSKPRWSDISMYIGLEKGQKAYDPKVNKTFVAGLDATVVTIEGYNEEGKSSKLVYDTAMAKALVELNGNNGVNDMRVVAQIVAAAYNQKNIGRDEKGQLRGYDVILGLGSASTWNDRGSPEDSKNEDFYGTINILGATASASVFYNGFHIKADLAFYGDFAMVKSYSINEFDAANPGAIAANPSVLSKHSYYWGVGTSTIAAISISKGNWEVGYNGQFSNAKSINGHHRLEEDVTRNDNFRDSYNSNRIYISYQVTKNLKIKLSREYNFREGSVNGEYDKKGKETRTMATLVYQF